MTAQKLKIKQDYSLRLINAPKDFEKELGDLPDGVNFSTSGKNYQQIHWFVKSKIEIDAQVEKVINLLKEDVMLWIYYPKGSSKVQTDLTRDKGWESLKKYTDLQWLSLISFNEVWSAFALRKQSNADKQKMDKPKDNSSDNYINPTTKTVTLPPDVLNVLNQHKKEKEFFTALAYSHKKEYLQWILSAKQEQTRKNRINAFIERLGQGLKNLTVKA